MRGSGETTCRGRKKEDKNEEEEEEEEDGVIGSKSERGRPFLGAQQSRSQGSPTLAL